MKLEDVKPQASIIWSHVPRGGWGFVVCVPGVVVAKTRTRVKIQVRMEKSGQCVERIVRPESLRAVEREENRDANESVL